MKKLLKAILTTGLSLSCSFTAFTIASTPIMAEETFPGKGYNVIASESKIFKSNDEAYQYCVSRSWELYKSLGKEIQYQVIYLGQGQFQATFYAYNYQDGELPFTPSTSVIKSVVVTPGELPIYVDAGNKYQEAKWSPASTGMVLDVYGSKKDTYGDTWYYVKMDGQEGYILAKHTSDETYYTGVKTPNLDPDEMAFAKGKSALNNETRVFKSNDTAVAYASNFGVTISNRNGGKLLYYYVSYAGAENYVVRFYYGQQ